MAAHLFDENLMPDVGRGLALIGYEVYVVGDPPAPPRGSTDATNIGWCRERGAVLWTMDKGRKDKEILEVLRQMTDAHVVFVPEGMIGPDLAQNFQKREDRIDERLGRGNRLRAKVTRAGGFKLLG